jgi:hypothetical protein
MRAMQALREPPKAPGVLYPVSPAAIPAHSISDVLRTAPIGQVPSKLAPDVEAGHGIDV